MEAYTALCARVAASFADISREVNDAGASLREAGRSDLFDAVRTLQQHEKEQLRLEATLQSFTHHEEDIRERERVVQLVNELKPDAIVHTAAQPSHDKAAAIPFDDFDTNAVGTLNLLEATRRHAKEAPFVHMSTNKVDGDAPNEIP